MAAGEAGEHALDWRVPICRPSCRLVQIVQPGVAGTGPRIAIPNGPLYAFPPVYFPTARDFATGDTIQLSAGQEVVADLALVRGRYYEVKIPVVNAQPGPVQGLRVAVHAQGHRGPAFQLGFDPSNQAITGSLPNGNYTVEGSEDIPGPVPGSSSGLANVTVYDRPVNAWPMTLTPNTSIEINLQQDSTSGEKTPATRRREAACSVISPCSPLMSSPTTVARR